jgi:hypothetical protein
MQSIESSRAHLEGLLLGDAPVGGVITGRGVHGLCGQPILLDEILLVSILV